MKFLCLASVHSGVHQSHDNSFAQDFQESFVYLFHTSPRYVVLPTMADALCGPSNPLQSFQKHAQADRTLLQDRISGPRHSPAQASFTAVLPLLDCG
jgi:hypothetical protein